MADLKKVARDRIDQHAEELHALSQAIWRTPELNFQEHFAHTLLTKFLEEKGFQVERSFKLDTAFRATWGGETTSGPNVAVLCEYDALPEIGHGCGHNLIAEAGIAAGLGIKAAMETAGKPLGKLTVLGTPAEEGGGGKIELINKDVFKDVDVAMMVHPSPFNMSRFPCMPASLVSVKYRGRASHAAAFPWEGVNALDAAVMCYQGISNMRQQFKPSWRVNVIIKNGGAKANIIPDFAELELIIRAETDADLKVLKDKLYNNFHAAASATGCSVEIIPEAVQYSAMVINSSLIKAYEANAADLDIQFEPVRADVPRGSTDMGNVSHVVPSIHPMYSVGRNALNHTREFTEASGDIAAQPNTLNQGKALAMTAIDVFTSPGLLQAIKDDFRNDMALV
ncbi:peptidase M20 domain-containing protein 2-like [Pomacea canaliculata]|uniref:peptidase M20 domain-containing protein 2-like n=1 Tax=Pomacea canaliculata TaxID=400727 RepID=UPI000D72CD91|nr:peptidase M20 domain-containing protein 2-like [Pomacea canaliculata]XP_025099823.1 peptidase M20 domain-containing protein 2-like [Pomacea canaliculata]XP_025099824.1 peptidase M20 domain-containing protein 2-like [Pomacea canaliculata]XP_025099825.1 peptidase M20 domain-containing protein 2-like [Pomacea canaliculata]